MTDKVQKIREEVERLYNQSLADENRQADRGLEHAANVSYGKSKACKQLISFIDSLQEKSVSEELEEAAKKAATQTIGGVEKFFWNDYHKFKAGAKWQKENLWKPADGDTLPEYDREVIAILDYDFGHYKVVYAHRPNPNGWNGTNIDTGEKEHFEPVIYDKGGWNQPHALYWLDAKLPYEENKIIKEL